jgi:aspartate 1-decarboxylase
VLKGEAGSGVIGINGAAARLVSQGDKIIIFAHLLMDPSGMESHHAEVVVVDEANRIAERLRYPGSLSEDPASLVEDGAATGYRPERDPSTPLAARNSLLEP